MTRITSTLAVCVVVTLVHPAGVFAQLTSNAPDRSASTAPRAIRPLHEWIRRVIADMGTRSATLAALLDRAERSGAIIHIDEATEDAEWDGRLRFAGATGPYRYLRIDVRRLEGPSAAAILAHELQHAAEATAEPVWTTWEFTELFRRIGFVVPSATSESYDTVAAIEAGVATLRELTGRVVYRNWSPPCASTAVVTPSRALRGSAVRRE
jgi:hypothetical protein